MYRAGTPGTMARIAVATSLPIISGITTSVSSGSTACPAPRGQSMAPIPAPLRPGRAVSGRPGGQGRPRGGRVGAGGQQHADRGTQAWLGVDVDGAAGPGDDAVHGGQAQPGPAALGLGREERLRTPGPWWPGPC